MRTLLHVLRTLVAVLAGAVAVMVAVALVLPNLYVHGAAAVVRATTGFDPQYANANVAFFPLSLRVLELQVAAEGAGEPVFTADCAVVTVDLGALLARDDRSWSLDGESFVLTLPGQVESAETESPPPAEPLRIPDLLLQFREIRVDEFRVRAADDSMPYKIDVETLSLIDPGQGFAIDIHGTVNGEPLSLVGSVADAAAGGDREAEFEAHWPAGRALLQGTLPSLTALPRDLFFAVQATDLDMLRRYADMPVQRFMPLEVSGKLRWPAEEAGQLTVDAEGGDYTASFEAALLHDQRRYSVQDIKLAAPFGRVEAALALDLDARDATLKVRSPALDLTVEGEPMADKASGAASSATENLPGGIRSGWVDSLEEATASLPRRIPQLALLGDWRVQIDAAADRLAVGGGCAHDLNATADLAFGDAALQVRGALSPCTDRLTQTGADASAGEADQQTSDTSRRRWEAQASANLSRDADTRRAELRVEAELGGARGKLIARDAVEAEQPLKTQVSLAVDAGSKFATGWGPRLAALMPASADFDLVTEPGALHLDALRGRVRGSQLTGALDLTLAAGKPRIDGSLRADRLEFRQVPVTSTEARNEEADDSNGDVGPVFSSEPIPWRWLSELVADLEVTVDELRFNQAAMRDVQGHLRIDEGRLRLDPLSGTLANGGVEGQLTVDASDDASPTAQLSLVVKGLTPADLGQADKGLIDGGSTDLFAELEARVSSPADFAASLKGEAAVEVQRATLRNGLLDLFASDLLTTAVGFINPFSEKDDQTELECAAVAFAISDGVLRSDNTLAIETAKVKVRGGGTINLADETLALDFVPEARTGLGVGLGDLAQVVRIAGPLNEPSVVPDPSGVLRGGLKIGAAFASGGLSLLAEGLFDRVKNAGTDCGKIFDEETAAETTLAQGDTAISD